MAIDLPGRDTTAAVSSTYLRRVLPLVRPHRWRLIELAAYMVVDVLASLAMPLATKLLFDTILPGRDLGSLALWLVVVAALFLIGGVAGYQRGVVAGLVGELVRLDVMCTAFAQVQRLSIQFHARARATDLLTRTTSDVGAMQVVVGETLPGLILNIASLSVSALALLVLNWPLGVLVVALGLPVFALAYSRTSRSLHRAGRDLQDTFGATTAFLSENLVAQAVIRSFTLEPRAREMIDRFLLEIFRSRMQTVRLEALLTGGSDLIYYGTRLAVLAAGAVLVLNDRLSLGELVAALWLTGAVFQPVAGMMTHYRGLVGAAGAFDRVRELLEEQVVGVDPALLGRVPLLAPVAAPMLAAIASRVSVETYAAGVTIVRQTELAEKLFIIASGSVEVLREDRGFVHRVRVLGERDYFGEIALFGSPGKRRIASVRTLEPTDVYGLHRDDFALILDAEPRLAEAVRLLAASREERTAAFRSAVTARGDV